MSNNIKFGSLAIVVVSITVFPACTKVFSEKADEDLKPRLATIRAENKGKGTDWAKLETQCLNLIKDHNSPVEKGEIYSTIALIYAEKGYSSPQDVRIPKAIEYCRKALQHPLEVITACEMYGRWTGALMAKYRNSPENEFVTRRQEAATRCLTGLKLALDNKAPKKREPPPPVFRYNIPPSSPNYDEMFEKHRRQLAAYKKWEFTNGLYKQREALTQRCVTLYTHKPYATNELRLLAEKILKKYDAAVEKLIALVEAEIARKEKRSSSNRHAK